MSDIEIMTGPLGQGVVIAVALAITLEQLAALFSKDDLVIALPRIYCITRNGFLQEGAAQEAMVIAGHMKLDNLVPTYDNKQDHTRQIGGGTYLLKDSRNK